MAATGGAGQGAGGGPARARLMEEVAEEMDAIDAEFGEDYQIGRVITIVEILRPGDDGQEGVGLRVRAGQYPWVALGMLDTAKKIVEAQLPQAE
jgi:hypothetical protein